MIIILVFNVRIKIVSNALQIIVLVQSVKKDTISFKDDVVNAFFNVLIVFTILHKVVLNVVHVSNLISTNKMSIVLKFVVIKKHLPSIVITNLGSILMDVTINVSKCKILLAIKHRTISVSVHTTRKLI